MNKEELEKEATEYALEWGEKTDGTYAYYRDGYLDGAEPREKQIEELKERIHTLEVYLEGAINFLILNGDVDNPIIGSVENILHITFNKNWR